MPGISIHVVDVSRGRVATGMRVELHAADADGGPRMIVDARVSERGLIEHQALSQTFQRGYYEARFHIADFYRHAVNATEMIPFLDVVTYRFGVADPEAHYHLPMKCTPWGYSCFRGGA